MSEVTQVPLACATCHRLLDVRVCKSNKNSNEGKRFVSCHRWHTNGTTCSYYHWLDRSQGSTSPSHNSSTSGSFLTSLPPSPPLTFPTPASTCPLTIKLSFRMAAEATRCAKTGCKSTRLHPDCLHHMCRRHCAEAGRVSCQGPLLRFPIFAIDTWTTSLSLIVWHCLSMSHFLSWLRIRHCINSALEHCTWFVGRCFARQYEAYIF